MWPFRQILHQPDVEGSVANVDEQSSASFSVDAEVPIHMLWLRWAGMGRGEHGRVV